MKIAIAGTDHLALPNAVMLTLHPVLTSLQKSQPRLWRPLSAQGHQQLMANRQHPDLADVLQKVCTQDLFGSE